MVIDKNKVRWTGDAKLDKKVDELVAGVVACRREFGADLLESP